MHFSYKNISIPKDGSSLLWVISYNLEDNAFVKFSEKERLIFVICLRIILHIPYSWFDNSIFDNDLKQLLNNIDFSKNLCGEGDIIYTKLYFLKVKQIFELHIPFEFIGVYSIKNDKEKDIEVIPLSDILLKESQSKKIYEIELNEIRSIEDYQNDLLICKTSIEKLKLLLSIDDEKNNVFVNRQIQIFDDEISKIKHKLK
jgi:hypothetical protein